MVFHTEIPRQSGLGGSTVLVLLTLVGLVRFYRSTRAAQPLRAGRAGPAGGGKGTRHHLRLADRYVPIFGGLAYIDYRGKLLHAPSNKNPMLL